MLRGGLSVRLQLASGQAPELNGALQLSNYLKRLRLASQGPSGALEK